MSAQARLSCVPGSRSAGAVVLRVCGCTKATLRQLGCWQCAAAGRVVHNPRQQPWSRLLLAKCANLIYTKCTFAFTPLDKSQTAGRRSCKIPCNFCRRSTTDWSSAAITPCACPSGEKGYRRCTCRERHVSPPCHVMSLLHGPFNGRSYETLCCCCSESCRIASANHLNSNRSAT